MKTHADKSPETQRQAAAHAAIHKQDGSDAELQFIDNREETADLRQLQEVADNSPQAQGLAQLSAMMNNGHRSAVMQNLYAMVDNSPRQVAQRQQHSRVQSAPMGLQAGSGNVSVQRVEDEELLQGKFTAESPVQLAQQPDVKPNNTGLPDNLKSGIESLSGMSMDNVKVHYNSSEPAQLNAHAYAQGTDIHVAPGQEQHLPHEAWHVVQQAQGRVKPTVQMKDGVGVNDEKGLEAEADLMGSKAISGSNRKVEDVQGKNSSNKSPSQAVIQQVLYEDFLDKNITNAIAGETHGELDEAAEEREWGKIMVNVYYESDTITTKGDEKGADKEVTPDTLSLRLGFLVERGRETFIPFWKNFGEGKAIDFSGDLSMKMQDYWSSTFQNDLERLSDPSQKKSKNVFNPKNIDLMTTSLMEFQKHLPGTDEACTNYKPENKLVLANYLIYQINSMTKAFNDGAEPVASADEWRNYRSTAMAIGIDEVLKGGEHLIYKVGNSHIGDIKKSINDQIIEVNAKTAILTKDEYIEEFMTLITATDEVEQDRAKKKKNVDK